MPEHQMTTVVREAQDLQKVVGTAGIGAPGPNVVVQTMSIAKMIGVRVLRTYLQSYVGILAMDGMGLVNLAPAGDAFAHLLHVASIALGPATVSLIHNAAEFLTHVDTNHPRLRA